jgi:YHS domain-containing protein
MRTQLFFGTAASVILLFGCAEPTGAGAPSSPLPTPEASPTIGASPAKAPSLVRVEPSQVCMMNNRFMGAQQIPVEVEGKTYFGCCAMCEAKLKNDAATRTGKDPVTGKPVDKATAIIGKKPDGTVLYFENEESFSSFAGT